MWPLEQPIVSSGGKKRTRSLGTVEASVTALAAAINFAHERKDTLFKASFSVKAHEEVSRTASYRADIKTLAAMFR